MKTFIIISIIVLSCISCESLLIRPKYKNTAKDNFEALWNTVHERYAYFELKHINWDSVRQVHAPRVYENMPDGELFKILGDMLYTLRDGHVNLESEFDMTRNWRWYLDRPENFSYSVLERNYLQDSYKISGPLLNRKFGDVGYIYYGSFQSRIRENELESVLTSFQGVKGIIIDIRNNGGGSLGNAEILASRFTDLRRPVLRWEYKTGPGTDDFEEAETQYISPSGLKKFTGPVVVLTNRSSYSAATFFTAMMKSFPNVITMGDTTGGGGGLPWLAELPNGWIYRFSSTRSKSMQGKDLEPGVPADIVITQTSEDVANGRDPILEAAIERLSQ